MSQFDAATHPHARKPHRCEYCGQMILKGEQHYKFVGQWEGEFQSWRMHNECAEDFHQSGDDYFDPWSAERPVKASSPAVEPNRIVPQTDHTYTNHT